MANFGDFSGDLANFDLGCRILANLFVIFGDLAIFGLGYRILAIFLEIFDDFWPGMWRLF